MKFSRVLVFAATLLFLSVSIGCEQTTEFPGLAEKLSISLKYLVGSLPQEDVYKAIEAIAARATDDCLNLAILTEPIAFSASSLASVNPIRFTDVLNLAIEFDVALLQIALCPTFSKSILPGQLKQRYYSFIPNHGTNLTGYFNDFQKERASLIEMHNQKNYCGHIDKVDESFTIIKNILEQTNLSPTDINDLLMTLCLYIIENLLCSQQKVQ